jgi:hypothetical protein
VVVGGRPPRAPRLEAEKESYKAPLLLSVNCIAAGFGSTG